MLLTDEEIVRAVEGCYGGKGYSPLISERAIAQAQLDKAYPLAVKEGKRQVVEWLRSKQPTQLIDVDTGEWWLRSADFQELRREVEE